MQENQQFEMVAKTFQGLEDVLAEELRSLGAVNVEPGRRMVSFEGDKAMLYRANMCCRTALRILKPIYKFVAKDADELYEMVRNTTGPRYCRLTKPFLLTQSATPMSSLIRVLSLIGSRTALWTFSRTVSVPTSAPV